MLAQPNQAGMAPCPRCRQVIPTSSVFCPACGLQLAGTPLPPQPVYPTGAPMGYGPPPKQSHKVRNLFWGTVLVGVVVVMLWAAARPIFTSPTTAGNPGRPISTPLPNYVAPTEHDWALVVKAPDTYIGRHYAIWGCVSQFDSATGPSAFRANASYQREQYGFSGDNAYFQGNQSQLAQIVKDDEVQMKVTVLGSLSYSTQIGGQTTVPQFQVDQITTSGSC